VFKIVAGLCLVVFISAAELPEVGGLESIAKYGVPAVLCVMLVWYGITDRKALVRRLEKTQDFVVQGFTQVIAQNTSALRVTSAAMQDVSIALNTMTSVIRDCPQASTESISDLQHRMNGLAGAVALLHKEVEDREPRQGSNKENES